MKKLKNYDLDLCHVTMVAWSRTPEIHVCDIVTSQILARRAFLKRPENFSGPETVPQSSRNDFWVFLKAPEKFWARKIRHFPP